METILFYAIFNSQNNIASMRRYPELFQQTNNQVKPKYSLSTYQMSLNQVKFG